MWVGVVVYVFGLVGVGLMVSVSGVVMVCCDGVMVSAVIVVCLRALIVSVSGDVSMCCDGVVVSALIVVCSRAERYVSQEGLGVFVG